uniref:Uncharacterized protein n=1 Tax=Megaselia scalaris TaxID=36166 RepID=T1GED3_MEGSC
MPMSTIYKEKAKKALVKDSKTPVYIKKSDGSCTESIDEMGIILIYTHFPDSEEDLVVKDSSHGLNPLVPSWMDAMERIITSKFH